MKAIRDIVKLLEETDKKQFLIHINDLKKAIQAYDDLRVATTVVINAYDEGFKNGRM